jgi:hypothetical protein
LGTSSFAGDARSATWRPTSGMDVAAFQHVARGRAAAHKNNP